LLPEVTQVDINNTMNAQNGSAIGESMLTSPLPTNQHFPAGAILVEPRRIPTGTTAERRRDGNAIDNDCATITINIATYNIRDGRNSNLEAALRACEQMRIHFAVLTETKLSTDRYTRSAYGYTVFATKTNHINQGGIAVIFTNNSLYFQVESQQRHGPNVISCILRTGHLQHPIIGAYIPPGDTTTLSYISDASQRFFQGQPIILMGDINVDLRTTTPDNRDAEIMALLSTLGLEDMSTHFIQRQGFRHGNTWHMMREGTRLEARCDYILGTDRRIFQYIRLKNPNYISDHLMVTGGIRSGEKADNIKYLRSRRKFPLRNRTSTTTTNNDINNEYDKLKQSIKIQDPEVERRAKAPWISKETWKLIDARASKSKSQSFKTGEQKRLSRCIERSLNRDRKQRTTDAGNEIKRNLKDGQLKKAWKILKHWYKHYGDRPPKPTRQDLQKVSHEYRILYSNTQPPGDPINTHISTCFTIDDEIPDDDEIAAAIRSLRPGKAPGPSGIRAEQIKELLQ
jgi:hypothetical protein